jgi:hypothetical protein
LREEMLGMDMMLSYHGETLIKNPQFARPALAGNVISLGTQKFSQAARQAGTANKSLNLPLIGILA